MSAQGNRNGGSKPGGGEFLGVIIGGGLVLFIVVKVIEGVVLIVVPIIAMAYEGVLRLIDIIVAGICLTLAVSVASIGLGILIDMLRPMLRSFSLRQRVHNAVKTCAYPTINAFRSGESASDTDRFMAEPLAAKYKKDFGQYPDASTFYRDLDSFNQYKRLHMVSLMLNDCAGQVNDCFISPMFAAYLTGENKELVRQVDAVISAERISHPALYTARVLNTLSFGKLFRKTSQNVRYADPADLRNNELYLKQLLLIFFFRALPDIERYFHPIIHLEPREQAIDSEWHEAESEPLLLNYQASHDPFDSRGYAQETDSTQEGDVFDADFADVAELQRQSTSRVEDIFAPFQMDSDLWNDPEVLLYGMHDSLQAELPIHPDPDTIHQQLAFLATAIERLPAFEAEFNAHMNRDYEEGEGWPTSWLQAASAELGDDWFAINSMTQFKRIALRHFLSNWVALSPDGNDDHSTTAVVAGF